MKCLVVSVSVNLGNNQYTSHYSPERGCCLNSKQGRPAMNSHVLTEKWVLGQDINVDAGNPYIAFL